jgi:hypothetical protein
VLIRRDVALALPAIAAYCLSDRAADRTSSI